MIGADLSKRLVAAAAMAGLVAATPGPKADDLGPIAQELDRQCAAGTFSGVVVIRAHRRDIFERECGMADRVNGIANARATRFKIYSTSKFITALTVMRLVEQRRMRLDAPLSTYLTDIPSDWSGVTVRQLLNHTSGIADLTEALVARFTTDHDHAMRAVLAALTPDQRRLASAPGAQFHYNNFGFELLADAAAHAAGKPFASLVSELIFVPAGMKTASIEAPNIIMGHPASVTEAGLAIGYNGAPGKLEQATNYAFVQLGAGAVRASVDDFIALDAALDAGTLVSPASLAEMARTLVADDAPGSTRRFGLGVIVGETDGVTMQGHTGGTNGYISDFERYREDGVMMIALTNLGFVRTKWLRDGVATMIKASR